MVEGVSVSEVDVHAAFARTVAGQREAVFANKLLRPSSRRLLLIVNGHTPLSHLLERDIGADHPIDEAVNLLRLGLIDRVS